MLLGSMSTPLVNTPTKPPTVATDWVGLLALLKFQYERSVAGCAKADVQRNVNATHGRLLRSAHSKGCRGLLVFMIFGFGLEFRRSVRKVRGWLAKWLADQRAASSIS